MSLSKEEIIRMAIQCGINGYNFSGDANALSDFFNAAFEAGVVAEREACAELCDDKDPMPDSYSPSREFTVSNTVKECAKLIRARGNGGEEWK